jgi:hypothetical protein
LRRGRPLGLEAELEMADEFIDGLRVFDEGDDTHLASARRTETMGFAGKHEEMLFPTVWTADAGKPAHRIATFEITVHHFLYNGMKVPVVTLKTRFIFQKKTLKIMEKHPVENAALWMTLTIYPCHSTRTLVH